jgi:uncharacterized membrane protein
MFHSILSWFDQLPTLLQIVIGVVVGILVTIILLCIIYCILYEILHWNSAETRLIKESLKQQKEIMRERARKEKGGG